MPASVCAVVVTYNRAELLARCLGGLAQQTRPVDSIVVIDNASTDDTVAMLNADFPDVDTVHLSENTGASGGFAEGVRQAHGRGADWIWILDDDVVPERGCLEELLAVAEASGKPVVAPRRRETDGTLALSEPVIDETAQRWAAPPESDARWTPVDLFTFEGPLVRRSVVDRIGLPNARFFILADDFEYGIRLYHAEGPLAVARANRTALDRQLPLPGETTVRSRLKAVITGDPTVVVHHDAQFWKHAYYLRNRHLLWKAMGWRGRRLRQLAAHAGYLASDTVRAMRAGWDWRLRLGLNARAFWLGLRGRDGVFVHPADYHAERTARAARTAENAP